MGANPWNVFIQISPLGQWMKLISKKQIHIVCLAKGQSQWLAWMVKMILKSVLFRLLEISLIPSASIFFVINLLDKHLCYNNTVILPSSPPVIPTYTSSVFKTGFCAPQIFYLHNTFQETYNDGTLYWSLASIQSSPKLA